MRRPSRSLAEREASLPDLFARADPAAPFDEEALQTAVLDGSAEEACAALWAAVEEGVDPPRLARALVLAAAERLLRFDLEVEFDPTVAEGWLWATHRLTFASAVREAADSWRHPDVLRLLLQDAAFIQGARGMDAPPDRRHALDPRRGGPEQLRAALDGRRGADAVALSLGAGWSDEERRVLLDPGLGDRFVRPIFSAHGLKTACAALRELDALGDHPRRALPTAAAARFLASPVVEDRRRDIARRAMQFLVDGKPPRKLTG